METAGEQARAGIRVQGGGALSAISITIRTKIYARAVATV